MRTTRVTIAAVIVSAVAIAAMFLLLGRVAVGAVPIGSDVLDKAFTPVVLVVLLASHWLTGWAVWFVMSRRTCVGAWTCGAFMVLVAPAGALLGLRMIPLAAGHIPMIGPFLGFACSVLGAGVSGFLASVLATSLESRFAPS